MPSRVLDLVQEWRENHKTELPKFSELNYQGDYRVWLKFADGVEGEVDLESELWGEVFQPLKDKARFAELSLDGELKRSYGRMGQILHRNFFITSYALTMRSADGKELRDLALTLGVFGIDMLLRASSTE